MLFNVTGPTTHQSPVTNRPACMGAVNVQVTPYCVMAFRAGGLQASGGLVDPENHDIVRVLIGCKDELPRGIDAEVPRCLAACGLVAGGGGLAGLTVDREDRQAVVPAV